MSGERLDIVPVWANLNDSLIRLVDYVPDDKINWSPKPELWNFRGILLHIAAARDGWLTGAMNDGVDPGGVWRTVRTRPQIQDAYRRTWGRLESFLSSKTLLDARYETADPGEPPDMKSGHWIAFHLLEHDIHHRANILDYLALLGIETPDVGTP
jgi:uncharacterized damage-inducible protein DinB